jgi:hypothetical protein
MLLYAMLFYSILFFSFPFCRVSFNLLYSTPLYYIFSFYCCILYYIKFLFAIFYYILVFSVNFYYARLNTIKFSYMIYNIYIYILLIFKNMGPCTDQPSKKQTLPFLVFSGNPNLALDLGGEFKRSHWRYTHAG